MFSSRAPGLLIALAVLTGGCGATEIRSVHRSPFAALNSLPSAADYGTIKAARAARNDALFHEQGWRKKSFTASLGAQTLLTVRLAPGPCATYVVELYGNLRDLIAAYPGEDWRPLVRLVRHEPSLADACARRRPHITA